jgi:hypothetical protein
MTLKLLFLVLVLFGSSGAIRSQTHLTLVLKTSLPIDSAYVGHFTDKEFVRLPYKETLEIDFKSGPMDFYHINYLQKEKVFNQKMYLESGNITVFMRIENDKLLIDKVIGSEMSKTVEKWKEQYAAVVARKDPAAVDAFLLRTYEEQIDNMYSFSIGSKYLDIHQNNKLKLYALLPLIARQGPELRNRFGFSFLNDRLQGIIKNNNVALGEMELIDRKNRPARASLKHEFTILDFWFVGCLPCEEDHKQIRKLLPGLKQKNAGLISISDDDSFIKWKRYLDGTKYPWPQYKKPMADKNIITQLGITTYPTYILLDRTGTIIFSSSSLKNVVKQLGLTSAAAR